MVEVRESPDNTRAVPLTVCLLHALFLFLFDSPGRSRSCRRRIIWTPPFPMVTTPILVAKVLPLGTPSPPLRLHRYSFPLPKYFFALDHVSAQRRRSVCSFGCSATATHIARWAFCVQTPTFVTYCYCSTLYPNKPSQIKVDKMFFV